MNTINRLHYNHLLFFPTHGELIMPCSFMEWLRSV